MTILPLTYLGSTEWFEYLSGGDAVIDVGENWVKQTARNRCEIMTSGGVAVLVVPVHGGSDAQKSWNSGDGNVRSGRNAADDYSGAKIATKDVRIDNSKRWQHQHWISLVSAYRNSPFFDHYEERFAPLYTARKFNFLTDLNLELLNILTAILVPGIPVKISENHLTASQGDVDLRGKKALRRELATEKVKYTQVFSDRIPFVGGLSIVDLLMCEGPSAREVLMQAARPSD